MNTVHRVRVILDIQRHITASVLGRAYAVANGMGGEPATFTAPVPPLATLQAQIVKTEAAEHVAHQRTLGAAAARDVEREILVGMVETEASYVQTLCDANRRQAIAIAQAAGFAVARPSTRYEPLLKATVGIPSGTVLLDANATVLAGRSGRMRFFNWQWTIDGGKTFNNAPATPHARTTIGGLTPLTMVGFRVCVTNALGTGEWSPVVTILVL